MDEKENNKIINKKVFENILIATVLMLYFIIINFLYNEIQLEKIILILRISAITYMCLSIILFEIAYKKDSGKIAINAIEALVIAGYTLSVTYVISLKNIEFGNYILISSYIVSIYYVMKDMIIFTKEKKKYLESLSDIKDIVSNEPQKKKAERRNQEKKK